MARLAEAAPILEAAEQWKNDCLLGGGSVFSDKSLWTRPNFEALNRFYVNNLDEGEGVRGAFELMSAATASYRRSFTARSSMKPSATSLS